MKSYRKKRTVRKQKNIVGAGLVENLRDTVNATRKQKDVNLVNKFRNTVNATRKQKDVNLVNKFRNTVNATREQNVVDLASTNDDIILPPHYMDNITKSVYKPKDNYTAYKNDLGEDVPNQSGGKSKKRRTNRKKSHKTRKNKK